MTILEAVRTGDRRTALVALRDKLAETLDSKDSARDVASNAKRLIEVLDALDALPGDSDASPLDRARQGRS